MRFLRFLLRDFHLKVIALFVAAVVWLYALLERTHTVALDLPVTQGRLPSGMVVASIDTGRVRAQVSGKGRDLMLLRLRNPAVRLNLTAENPGRVRVKLAQEQTNLPASVQLVSARPEYVNVDLDQQSRRMVKVMVPLRGKPPSGFVVTSARTQENAYLTGPAEEIGLVAALMTESLSLGEFTEPAERRLRVLAPEGKKFRVEPDSVSVAIRVEREETRVFPDVALTIIKPAVHNVVVKPATARVTVAGAAGTIRDLTLQGISASLKVTDTFPKGQRRMPCEIALPSGVTLVKCEPTLFDVEIK